MFIEPDSRTNIFYVVHAEHVKSELLLQCAWAEEELPDKINSLIKPVLAYRY